MTDEKVYEIVRNALFKDGSCSFDTWYTIVINNKPLFEASINSKGYIHIRKPIKKIDWYENRNDVFLYRKWRFNSKKELVDAGMIEGTKPNKEDVKEIIL